MEYRLKKPSRGGADTLVLTPVQAAPASEGRPPSLNFVDLLPRTLGIDLFTCTCGGRRSIVAFITSEEVARKALGLLPQNTSTAPPQPATAPDAHPP